ncbi:hypothetical protein [Enterovibrio nigricans]|uniref:hypothetical protein n=1 Tax=Enterovibrio nigricans TaxID=504469 RepID=UPI00099AB99C|nr:hypothetical protein [Enterovibrio nigricans]
MHQGKFWLPPIYQGAKYNVNYALMSHAYDILLISIVRVAHFIATILISIAALAEGKPFFDLHQPRNVIRR